MRKLLAAFGALAVVVALVVGLGVVTANRLAARMTPAGLWPADDDLFLALRLTSFGLAWPLRAFDRSHDEAAYDPERRTLFLVREVDDTPPVVSLRRPQGPSTRSTITVYRPRERVYTTFDPAYRVTGIAGERGRFLVTLVPRRAPADGAAFTADVTAEELADLVLGRYDRVGSTPLDPEKSRVAYLKTKSVALPAGPRHLP